MPTRPHHRTLTAHLREWTEPQVAELLVRRPDLLAPTPPTDLADLAQRAQHPPSVRLAIEATTLPENRLLQVVVCSRPDLALDELTAVLPAGVGLGDVEEPLAALERSALVWRHGGRLHTSGVLGQVMPTHLGPPLHQLVQDQTVEYLVATLRTLLPFLDEAGGTAPLSAIGPTGRPPRKAELVEQLAWVLGHPGVVDAVLATGSTEATDLARELADDPHPVRLGHSLYFSRYRSPYYERLAAYWLFERGMLLPVRDGFSAWQPREVTVALRGGRPVADLELERPVLVTGNAGQAEVDRLAAQRGSETLHAMSDLLDRWREQPVKELKSGGLGATVRKQAAAGLDVDPEEAGRLIELAHLAGMLETSTVRRKENRRPVVETFVSPGVAAVAWTERPLAVRWYELAAAWLRAEHWPSVGGRKDGRGKSVPLLEVQWAADAPERRAEVLGVLASLGPGEATAAEALARSTYWTRPQPWLKADAAPPETLIRFVHDEAELLGVVAAGALSAAGRALLAGDREAAEAAFEVALPEPARTFTLQADLTAVVVGDLAREALVELRLLADLESTGAASTWRFSEASLRRAVDAGRDAAGILSFLEAHADRGVPAPLEYLVHDVVRRHGHLQVGAAASFVTSDDVAVLADACSHRRTRKLGLRLLAPTVAVSPHPPAKVIAGLRDAGFLPTADGDAPEVVAIVPPAAEAAPTGPGFAGVAPTLPEPFRARSRRGRTPSDPPGESEAAELAAAIVAGVPGGDTQFRSRSR
jgi:hypothetical protein